jgi:hypothetical protein
MQFPNRTMLDLGGFENLQAERIYGKGYNLLPLPMLLGERVGVRGAE